MPTKKKKQSALKRFGNALKPNSRSKQLLLFVFIFGVIGGGFYLYKSSAQTVCVGGVFVNGSTDPCVRDIQYLANYMAKYKVFTGSAYPPLETDAKYGTNTKNRITEVQSQYKYSYPNEKIFDKPVSVDGKVGLQTWWILCEYAWAPAHDPAEITYDAATNFAGAAAGCKGMIYGRG